MALKTDYKDDILDSSVNVNRTFSIIDNTTGQTIYPNVSLEETTVFSQEGDSHTAQITNEQNTEINQLNADLSVIVTASQIGSGTNTFSIPSTRKRLTIITKKSNVIVGTKEIPTSVLESGDVVLLGALGNTAPIIYSENSSSNLAGKKAGLLSVGQFTAPDTIQFQYPTADGSYVLTNFNGNYAADLSMADGATITYNGSNSFTITVTDSTLSVYVY